jgi:hypothetical protein
MDFLKNSHLLFIFLSLNFVMGCMPEEKKIEITEQQVAISFFEAIYNEKNAQKAISLSSSEFKKELEKYHSAKNIAHRLFDMRFDSVSLHTSAMKTQIINEFYVQVTMMVQFTGQRNGHTYKDYKKIRLIKENEKWVVDKLLELS